MARKRFSSEFKARVALEAIKGDKTVAQLASQYEGHATQTNRWKKQAQERLVEAFDGGDNHPGAKKIEAQEDRLYRQIGREWWIMTKRNRRAGAKLGPLK